jgi:hypothetical protein
MRRFARGGALGAWLLALLAARVAVLHAHSGPPFPIVSNRAAGPYVISLWTDPDATNDGSAAGQFWVMVEPAQKGAVLPPDTRATVSIAPLDRKGTTRVGRAGPVNHELSRQFVALVMDHEGPFSVEVTIEGTLGASDVAANVDATYDLRPRPIMLVVYVMPFLLVGFLWLKLLVRRRTDTRTRMVRER